MLILIVDMQTGLFNPQTPRHDADGVVRRINRLISTARQNQYPVIFIQHDGPAGDALEPFTPGWEIIDALDRAPQDTVIRKTACDAFLDTPLLSTIRSMNQDQILITGCATDFCVDTTVRSAASKGLDVRVAGDAHTTADRPHLDAGTIIAHHNWSWANLILPGGRTVCVENTEALIKEI